MKKERTINVDVVRLIISLMVVAIHTYPLQFISDDVDFYFTRVICRICVPFFFMITGFFVISKAVDDRKVLIDYTKKMLIMYAISMVIYLPILIYTGYFKDFSLWLFIKDILFDGYYFHLWYFPALILGTWITYFAIKKFDLKRVGVAFLVLYLIGLLGDSYYGLSTKIPFVKTFFDRIFAISFYTRNGVFYAPMFLYFGYSININKVSDKTKIKKYLLLGIISYILMIGESYILHTLDIQRHTSMYLLLLPTCYFLFKYMMNSKTSSNKFLRESSTWIYIMHPFILTGIRFVANYFGCVIFYKHSLLYFVSTSILSFAFAASLVLVKNKVLKKHETLKV